MPALLLLVAWIVAESWLLSRLIERIGVQAVVLWLLLAVVAGVVLIQHQGLRTIRELQMATQRGELPAQALLEAAVTLVAGLLLILPGMVSDAIALSLLLLGLRKRLATRIGEGMARARPDLKKPVTLDGEYRRKR